MDFALLSKVVDELAAVLPGARVEKVVQRSGDSLVLALHQGRRNRFLLISADRAFPRMHLVGAKPAGAAAPSGSFLSLRKHLTRSRLLEIRLVNEDRVVELHFSGPSAGTCMVVELTGAASNIILLAADRRILSVLAPMPPGDTARPLIPGIVYQPPEKRQRRKATADIALPEPAGSPADLPVNGAVEAWYERTIAESEFAALRKKLAAAISGAMRRTERRRTAVAGDIAAAERADDHRLFGELLLANKRSLVKGQESAKLTGYDGAPVSIPLDPARSPAENAERYFRKYKKAKAGIAMMRERLSDASSELVFLKAQEEQLREAVDLQGLDAVQAGLAKWGYLPGAKRKRSGAGAAAPQPYRTVSFEGWDILVGKSAAGNDYITLKLARPDDLWLHAEGMPGSHVVVRNPQKRDIPDAVLRRAASLAAYHSKGKGSAKVAVAYTRAALVKKPKGAAPGTVVLAGRKTVMAAPEP